MRAVFVVLLIKYRDFEIVKVFKTHFKLCGRIRFSTSQLFPIRKIRCPMLNSFPVVEGLVVLLMTKNLILYLFWPLNQLPVFYFHVAKSNWNVTYKSCILTHEINCTVSMVGES